VTGKTKIEWEDDIVWLPVAGCLESEEDLDSYAELNKRGFDEQDEN
jgi:protein gp37